MSHYHYLISSLPFLVYDNEPLITRSEFLEACAGGCSKSDFRLIEHISLVPEPEIKGQNEILTRFYAWERALLNELIRLRSKKKGVEFEKYIREDDKAFSPQVIAVQETGPVQIARSAYQQESPLHLEETISRAQWALLDELETGHYFDLEKLIVYKIRLEILEKKSLVKEEKGRSNFQSYVDHFERNISA